MTHRYTAPGEKSINANPAVFIVVATERGDLHIEVQ